MKNIFSPFRLEVLWLFFSKSEMRAATRVKFCLEQLQYLVRGCGQKFFSIRVHILKELVQISASFPKKSGNEWHHNYPATPQQRPPSNLSLYWTQDHKRDHMHRTLPDFCDPCILPQLRPAPHICKTVKDMRAHSHFSGITEFQSVCKMESAFYGSVQVLLLVSNRRAGNEVELVI